MSGIRLFALAALALAVGPPAARAQPLVRWGSVDTPGEARRVAVAGSTAYVADGPGGLRLVDVTRPSAPFLLGSVPTTSTTEGVTVLGDLAYVVDVNDMTGDDALKVVDVSDRASPKVLSVASLGGNKIILSDDRSIAYTLPRRRRSSSAVCLFDISTPLAPRLIDGHVGLLVTDFALSGSTLFLQEVSLASPWICLRAADVTDPLNPRLSDWWGISTGSSCSIAARGDLVFFGSSVGVARVDIFRYRGLDDPPLFLGRIEPSIYCPQEMAISGDRLILALYRAGVAVYDISDPANPAFIAGYDTPGQAMGVAVQGDFIYVADGEAGLQILRLLDPTAARHWTGYDR